ncbi:MAG TPA: 4Fe-4S dicluster domain-containing protein [candidate division Zixibacteria bacterium]|nr:4Fe-4S dicluster domain-containing protein [candidate division Zixibacteria bacterium]
MAQYGFFFDQSRCTGCRACSIACKGWYDIPPGPLKYMRVYQWEQGAFPDVRLGLLAVNCYHCEKPACVEACPHEAIFKEEKYGAVLIDEERCEGERRCWDACPYGSIVYASDREGEKAHKCTMCIDRLEQGELPICVHSCSLRALDFGPIEELRKKYGDLDTLDGLPDGKITRAAVVFKPRDPKKPLLPYDADRALDLWRQRGPYAPADLPPTFDDRDAVTRPASGIRGRERLVLKARSAEELMVATRDDE